MKGLFGGPRRDKAVEAMQARLRQEESTRRAELEEEKSDIASSGRTSRRGRNAVRSRRSSSLKVKLGA